MSKPIEFFFDYVSPYTYLADARLPEVAERAGTQLVYRPMFLGGLMKASGNRPPSQVKAKGDYMLRDLERTAAHHGIPFTFNRGFPINTLLALRVAIATIEDGGFDAYHPAVFRAVWAGGSDVSDPAILRGIIAAVGLDADSLFARAGEDEIKEKLKANTEEAARRGAFGAPAIFVGEELFFGHDRLDFVERAV